MSVNCGYWMQRSIKLTLLLKCSLTLMLSSRQTSKYKGELHLQELFYLPKGMSSHSSLASTQHIRVDKTTLSVTGRSTMVSFTSPQSAYWTEKEQKRTEEIILVLPLTYYHQLVHYPHTLLPLWLTSRVLLYGGSHESYTKPDSSVYTCDILKMHIGISLAA